MPRQFALLLNRVMVFGLLFQTQVSSDRLTDWSHFETGIVNGSFSKSAMLVLHQKLCFFHFENRSCGLIGGCRAFCRVLKGLKLRHVVERL